MARRATEGVTIHTSSGSVVTTPEHPFAVVGFGWKPARSLRRGDTIASAAPGGFTSVVSVEAGPLSATVYNLTVEGSHSYLVGRDSLLVHNTCGTPGSAISGQELLRAADGYRTASRRAGCFMTNHRGCRDIYRYTTWEGQEIQKALRGQLPPGPERDKWLAVAQSAKQLLIDAVASGHGFQGAVSRGEARVGIPPELLRRYETMHAGETMNTEAFVATTVDPDTAEVYAGTNGVLLRFRGRSGVPTGHMSRARWEQEVLFPPGLEFRLISRTTDAEGRLVLDFEEVGRASSSAN